MTSETPEYKTINAVPHLEYLYSLRCKIAAPLDVGKGPHGYRRHIGILGGSFTGRFGLNGKVLNGGADDMIVNDSIRARVDTRYMLETDDGALIYIRTKGGRAGSPEAVARLEAGEEPNQGDWKFYLSVVLETGHEKYRWLNDRVIVANGSRIDGDICYDTYMVDL